MLVMVNPVVPWLVRVAGWDGLLVPSNSVPKFRLAGVSDAAVPVPLRATLCGLFAASSVMDTAALRRPAAEGVKVTVMVQEAPTASAEPQLLLCEKSSELAPPTAMLEILSGLPLLLVSVAVLGDVVPPSASSPKSRARGHTWSPGTSLATKAASFPLGPQVVHAGSRAPGVMGKSGE